VRDMIVNNRRILLASRTHAKGLVRSEEKSHEQ
jgi:hypothetical protein